MYAIEFETDINGDTVVIPSHLSAKIGKQYKHARIIILMDENEPNQSESKIQTSHFSRFQGISNTALSTDEIMAMTRDKE